MSNARDIADAGHTIKAWCTFDGTASSNHILNSFNCTTISDNGGTGDYTLNISTNITLTENACVATGIRHTSGDFSVNVTGVSANAVNIRTYSGDFTRVYVVVFEN